MSGGVDSSVVAARMVEAGHEVSGVYLNLTKIAEKGRGCSSPEDAQDAQRIADQLGIELMEWDLTSIFDELVIKPWVLGYSKGITPNPCLLCNRTIKFAAVQERALPMGFDLVATGHYARLGRDGDLITLNRARDRSKDQSYVLSVLTQDQLRRALFPLGDISSKAEVRAEAEARGLPVAEKAESFDICFIPDGNIRNYLTSRLGSAPGEIVDLDGRILGTHSGSHQFTIGQRKGLGIGEPAADGKPRYVVGIEPETNTVVVGSREDLKISEIRGRGLSWTGHPITEPFRGFAQVRAHGVPMPALFSLDGNEVVAQLDEPSDDVAPGQGLVIYDGDRVVGSATVTRSSLITNESKSTLRQIEE